MRMSSRGWCRALVPELYSYYWCCYCGGDTAACSCVGCLGVVWTRSCVLCPLQWSGFVDLFHRGIKFSSFFSFGFPACRADTFTIVRPRALYRLSGYDLVGRALFTTVEFFCGHYFLDEEETLDLQWQSGVVAMRCLLWLWRCVCVGMHFSDCTPLSIPPFQCK